MAEPEPQPRASIFPAQIPLPRFQFSLWWLMVVVTMVAVFLGVTAVIGDTIVWLLFISVVMCVLPTPLIIGALFGRGDVRAFAIGALVPWISFWPDMAPMPSGNWFIGRAILLTFFLLGTGTICGIVAVAARRWIERRGG